MDGMIAVGACAVCQLCHDLSTLISVVSPVHEICPGVAVLVRIVAGHGHIWSDVFNLKEVCGD
jgi:hypothetical protein